MSEPQHPRSTTLGPSHSTRPRGVPVRLSLLAVDLDGTLLRTDGSISARTRSSLVVPERAGLTIVTVTARPPRRVRQIAEAAELRGLAICSNGALIYDLASETAVQEVVLSAVVATGLVLSSRREFPGVSFAVEAGMRYGCEVAYPIPPEHGHDLQDAPDA